MGWLDSSGNIILDVVLTDEGRKRLARGDGSFKVVKFACFDDEIDYGIYDKNHPSGTSYFDIELLQTPIMEAMSNNSTSGKSKLLTIARDDLLYLPVLKLAEVFESSTKKHSSGAFVVAVDKDTETSINKVNGATVAGIINGETLGGGSYIRIDQGLDTSDIPPGFAIQPDLFETQYIVEIDNSLGSIVSKTDGTPARPSYIDDDNIASYLFSLGNDLDFVSKNQETQVVNNQAIAGPRGTILEFSLQASLELNVNNAKFLEIGTTGTFATGDSGGTVSTYNIDANVRITGKTTGYSIDIPVRFVRKQ